MTEVVRGEEPSWRKCHKNAEICRVSDAADFLGAQTGVHKG